MHLEMGTNYGETDEEEMSSEMQNCCFSLNTSNLLKYYSKWKQLCFSCISDKLLRLRKAKKEKFRKI